MGVVGLRACWMWHAGLPAMPGSVEEKEFECTMWAPCKVGVGGSCPVPAAGMYTCSGGNPRPVYLNRDWKANR